jgi:hypothetical protein
MRPFPLSVAGTFAVVLLASAASAEDKSDAARAGALFEEGRRLLAAEDFAAACPKLAESQALDPAPDTALDVGICYQKASQAAFKVAHDLAQPPEQPGGSASAPSRASAAEAEASSSGQTQRVIGLTIGGAGVAGIVAGVITGVMAKSAWDDAMSACAASVCGPDGLSKYRSAVDLATASTISLITGAVAVGAGAIVFFTAPKSKTGAAATVGIVPAAEGASLSVAGRF